MTSYNEIIMYKWKKVNKRWKKLPRKPELKEKESELKNEKEKNSENKADKSLEEEVEKLTGFLAAVLEYISDDEVEEIDIEYLLTTTEGLREWWEHYQERNRKKLEQEIRNSLSELSLEKLQRIHEQIKGT